MRVYITRLRCQRERGSSTKHNDDVRMGGFAFSFSQFDATRGKESKTPFSLSFRSDFSRDRFTRATTNNSRSFASCLAQLRCDGRQDASLSSKKENLSGGSCRRLPTIPTSLVLPTAKAKRRENLAFIFSPFASWILRRRLPSPSQPRASRRGSPHNCTRKHDIPILVGWHGFLPPGGGVGGGARVDDDDGDAASSS